MSRYIWGVMLNKFLSPSFDSGLSLGAYHLLSGTVLKASVSSCMHVL